MVGNFENISGSGFEKNAEIVSHPENDYEFIKSIGFKISEINKNRIG
jgi:hypothetical protein